MNTMADQPLGVASGRYICDASLEDNMPLFGTRPPDLYAYPQPRDKVALLFIGWNPPKPFGGFWSLEFEDNLRSELHGVLFEMKRIKARMPDAIFLDEFLGEGFYFVHAVKCWCCAKYPGFGRGAERGDRNA